MLRTISAASFFASSSVRSPFWDLSYSACKIAMTDLSLIHILDDVNAADQAVKICRINVNTSARNIREMALNNDTSAYDSYEPVSYTHLKKPKQFWLF